jgi:hypothetical protein
MTRFLQRRACYGALIAAVLGLSLGRADALPRYGPLELSGNVSAQELFRMRDYNQWDFIQQRNTFKLRVDLQTINQGRLFDTVDTGFIDTGRLYVLYRGVYDSVYGLTPGFPQFDIYGNKIGSLTPVTPGSPRLNLQDLPNRDQIAFENKLREAYTDLKLKNLPLSFRLGRQQIVWGETDNFRMLDRVNPLDLTWHLQQESWDELREPLWMIKGLWNIGRVGPLSDSFVEFFWNPGDWQPAAHAFLPRPWSSPIVDPLTDPRTPPGGGRGLFNIINTVKPKPCPKTGPCVGTLFNDTRLFLQGDYTRDPADNSQVGVRFSALTPQGVQFTLNYFYTRWNGGDDGTDSAAFQGITTDAQIAAGLSRGQAPIEAISPYVQAIGASANYADEDYTQAVFRAETIYEFGVPFIDASKHLNTRSPYASLFLKDVFGATGSNMWNGMLGFDRPTWIRPLNRNTTFLILGQFFWHYTEKDPPITCNNPNEGPPCTNSGQNGGFRGQFSTSGIASSGFSNQNAFIDKIRRWELLTTLAATTFYSGGKFVPFLVYILDPVNSFNMEVLWMADYFITNNLILNLSQRYFINTTSQPVFETWGVAGTNRGRSETGLRLTYQF